MEIPKLPPEIETLPKDYRGYPIPFMQFIPESYEIDKKVDFSVTDAIKRIQCLRERLCGICGKPLQNTVYFIGGPLSEKSGVFSDPAMHLACAEIAIKVCPYLRNDKYVVVDRPKELVGAFVSTDALGAVDRPDRMLLIKSESFEMVRVKDAETGTIHPMIYALSVNPKAIKVF